MGIIRGLSLTAEGNHESTRDHYSRGGDPLSRNPLRIGCAAAGSLDSNPLIEAASLCVKTGEICRQHCVDLLSSGDKSLSECLKSVNEMLTVSPCKSCAETCPRCASECAKTAAWRTHAIGTLSRAGHTEESVANTQGVPQSRRSPQLRLLQPCLPSKPHSSRHV